MVQKSLQITKSGRKDFTLPTSNFFNHTAAIQNNLLTHLRASENRSVHEYNHKHILADIPLPEWGILRS